jgi:DNA ligase D-like protein (predicted polymerase)
MAKDDVEIEVESSVAPARILRVSSASRIVFPATDITPAITKLELVKYTIAVSEPLLRVLHSRPTTLERWPNGVHPGMHLGRGADDGGFYQKRMIRHAPDYVDGVEITFPSGRTAAEVCPTEPAVLAWCAQMGTITFHPWPVRRTGDPTSVDKPDELRIDLDPEPGTTFRDVVRVALAARDLLEEFGITGYCKTSGGRGVHVFMRIKPDWGFDDVRHAAIAFGRELAHHDKGVTTEWWKELRGERVFVDYNQNCRDLDRA